MGRFIRYAFEDQVYDVIYGDDDLVELPSRNAMALGQRGVVS